MPGRTTVVLILLGVSSTAIGILFLLHPTPSTQPMVKFFVVPVVLIGVGLRRAWLELTLDAEAYRERHERRTRSQARTRC